MILSVVWHNSLDVCGCIKCKRSRCDLCKNFLIESNFFQSFQTNRKYFIKPRLSRDSKNVIYLASCNKCRFQYVGSTATQFKVRFRNHKSSMVTNKKTCEVAVHYNNSPHALKRLFFPVYRSGVCYQLH